jgi:hypothetical protein
MRTASNIGQLTRQAVSRVLAGSAGLFRPRAGGRGLHRLPGPGSRVGRRP